MVVKAPCCYSRRTCWDTWKYVIDVETKEVIEKIPAVRCKRGVERFYEIEVTEEKASSVVVVEHYISNRGVHRLYFEYPETPTPDIIDIVREILGLKEVRKLVVK